MGEERKRARQRSKATRNKERKSKTARLNMLTQDITQKDHNGEKAYASAVRSGKVQIIESNKNQSSASIGKNVKVKTNPKSGQAESLINSGKTKVSSSTFFSALQRELDENQGQYTKTKINSNRTNSMNNTPVTEAKK